MRIKWGSRIKKALYKIHVCAIYNTMYYVTIDNLRSNRIVNIADYKNLFYDQ